MISLTKENVVWFFSDSISTEKKKRLIQAKQLSFLALKHILKF